MDKHKPKEMPRTRGKCREDDNKSRWAGARPEGRTGRAMLEGGQLASWSKSKSEEQPFSLLGLVLRQDTCPALIFRQIRLLPSD